MYTIYSTALQECMKGQRDNSNILRCLEVPETTGYYKVMLKTTSTVYLLEVAGVNL